MRQQPLTATFRLAPLLTAVTLLAPLAGRAGLLGGVPAVSYAEAVARTEAAAAAVLGRHGRPSCLIGKLTNALLLLSSSCEAAGQRTALCALADRAVVSSGWTIDFADATARQLLEQATANSAMSSARSASEAQAATP
jgi:hypothetical protein